MVTMLDCIMRTPLRLIGVLNGWKDNSAACMKQLESAVGQLEQIIFVGSGTSNTAAITSRAFVEKASGLQSRTMTPNEFLYGTKVYPERSLYVFTSQTGTSIVSREALKLVREMGLPAIAITESEETVMAGEADLHLTMGCGYEEHPMRTIGYSCSVLVHMLLGMELGLRRGYMDETRFHQLTEDAFLAVNNQPAVIEAAINWMERAKHLMLRAECIIFTGADELYGVSLEGAMKVWETPQIPCVGYEIEEGIHGPNYGYSSRHSVIVLNGGGREQEKLLALAAYMKDIYGSGLVAGTKVLDDRDLQLEIRSRDFKAMEFAPVVQCIAYQLAVDFGRDMSLPHDNSRMERYFVTHSESVGS